METETQLTFFGEIPKLEKLKHRRRMRTEPTAGDELISCRSERMAKRNRVLTARYYYWTEIERRRFDDAVRILSDREFFIDDRRVTDILVNEDPYYRELIRNNTTRRQLRRLYPGFDWN
ncbi:hypothetical protein [uncultured Alistipes sp.]|uniref:hypothetical protein n=1 Tax=uncultured Alistipes sp. TaxID=538949 RepID=UPI0025CB8567|nr:hypothetical protein [uncultured Alistipes sp.]